MPEIHNKDSDRYLGGDKVLRGFVVGCPRSGTTLVQSRLAVHPAIYSFPETQLFPRLIGTSKLLSGQTKYRNTRDKLLDYLRRITIAFGYVVGNPAHQNSKMQAIGEHINSDEFSSWIYPKTRHLGRLVDYAISKFDTSATNEGCQCWIEKSPTHLRYLPFINRHVTEARVIHVVRDGRATVASIWEASQNDYPYWRKNFPSIDACISTWNSDYERTMSYSGKAGHLLLNYHDFCTMPDVFAQQAREFLGVNDTSLNSMHCQTKANEGVILDYEVWKESVKGPVSDYGLKKFNSLFSGSEKRQIEEGLRGAGVVPSFGDAP